MESKNWSHAHQQARSHQKELKEHAPETAVNDQENGNDNGQQSGTVSKRVDPGKETKSIMEQDTRVNSVGRFYCCIVWGSQNFKSPTSNTASHFKIVPLWLFYLLHVSFTRNSAVHRLKLCSNYVFEESIWKAGRMKRDMLAFLTRSIAQCQSDKPRHSALNKWWIYTKNDCLPFAKTLPPHCSFKKGTSHTWNSAFKAFFNQQQELAWSEIRYFFSYTYVVIYWLLQRKSGNSTPVPFGNMENLLSAEQIKIIRE